ncbi:helix-turn-helix transcriptional regulator [Aquimarina sp. U1-2]|uniref:helix-turn-helix domain-containing protein n=1 Tax=Aquimarina sp. U1-2 TaxID=2823141 RepID=UPI001AEC7675|nr:AraC family transcriptional regulator [Aquimarina sp. U1-2]MBP2831702.1 helix-turn-helix transcriptional regulator [Aquimarina sp. U1-2]
MTNITKHGLSTIEIPAYLKTLQELLSGTIITTNGGFTLELDTNTGVGNISYTYLQKGLQCWDFDIELASDLSIPAAVEDKSLLQFFYCLEGNCYYQSEDFEEYLPIEELYAGVTYSATGQEDRIHFRKGNRVRFNVMCLQHKEYGFLTHLDSTLFDQKVDELIVFINEQSKPFYLNGLNLSIREQLKFIGTLKSDNNIANILYEHGGSYLVFGKFIEQFLTDTKMRSNGRVLFKRELKIITQLSDYIKDQPELRHSISNLSLRSGIPPKKLQNGFKLMHNKTVAEYIRNVRLEKAEVLLRTTDLNVSEVVYSIGLTSRSYFCKIFRDKYHCNPSDYKSNL